MSYAQSDFNKGCGRNCGDDHDHDHEDPFAVHHGFRPNFDKTGLAKDYEIPRPLIRDSFSLLQENPKQMAKMVD